MCIRDSVYTLQTIDFLDRVHQVSLRVFFSQDGENIVRVQRPVNQWLARPNVFAFLYVDVHAARDGIFFQRSSVFAFYEDLALALNDVAVLHDAVDFANDRGILRLARFEKFHNARETARDVFRLGRFSRDLRQNVARLHLVPIRDHQVRARRHQVLFADASLRIANENRGLVLFVTRRKRDDQLRQPRDLSLIHI